MKPNKLYNKERLSDDELWRHAVELMPRGSQTLSKCPDQFTKSHPIFAEKGFGAYIYDRKGNKYLDFMSSLGPVILGHQNPRVNNAIIKQLQKGIVFSLPSVLEQELAELIIQVVPSVEQVKFAKNGTDATLAAVRIARSFTGKEKIAKSGYHGWGDWHGITLRPYGIPSCLKEIISEFEYNNLDSLEELLKKEDVAGVIMEAQALTPPNPGFLEGVRELTTKYGALLIFDEVVTGFRWALGGAQEKFGVMPDLTCMGKAIANGLPLSVIGGKKEYMQELNHAFFSLTFGGELLSIVAAIETIKELQEKNYDHIWNLGNKFSDGMNEMAEKHGLKILFQGSAPRHHLEFSDEYPKKNIMKDVFSQEMAKQNILWSNVLYTTFAHTKEDIQYTIDCSDNAFKLVSEHLDHIQDVLTGLPSTEVFRKNT